MSSISLLTTFISINRADKQEGKKGLDYLLIDTPGQIEIFTWSASGAIITDAISSGQVFFYIYK